MAANTVEIRITASGAEQAAKVLLAVGQAGGQIGSITAPGVKKAEDALNSLGATAKRVFEVFAGVNLAHVFEQAAGAIKDFVTESAKLGLEAKVQEDAFAKLTQQVGVSGDALVKKMQEVSGGILNTSDVMVAASKALLEGLQPEQIIKLMEIARQQAKLSGMTVADTFNSMAAAIGNQQEKGLKAIRINIDATTALDKYAVAIGTTATNLTDMQKTQAFYLATVEKTTPVVAALTTEQRTQKEVLEKASGAWKQFKEDLGKFEVDAGFKILEWLVRVKKDLGDLTPILTGVGQVWAATWATATVNFTAFKTDVSGLKNLIKDIGLVFAQVGFGISTVFMITAGAAAGIGSLLEDIGNKKLPDISKAMETAVAKQKEAFAAWTDARRALQALADGTTPVVEAQTKLAAVLPLGTNNLGAQVNVVKAGIPVFDALEKAMRALSDKALAQQLSEDDAKLLGLTQGVRNAVAETKNLGPAARDALLAYADGVAQGIVAGEEMIAQLKEINALVRAGATEKPTQSPIGAQIQDLDIAAKRFRLLADAERLATEQIAATEKAIDALLTDGFDPMDEGLQTLVAELRDYRDALIEAQRVIGISVSVTEAFRKGIEATVDPVATLVTELHAAQNEALSFGGAMTSTAGEIAATEKAIRALASEFGDLDPVVVQLRADLAGLKETRVAEDLQQIGVIAQLLGPNFDSTGAVISRMQQRLKELSDEAKGEITPEMRELGATISGMIDEARLKDALGLTRTTFDQMVDAARATAQHMTAAFSDLFFAAFTGQLKTAADIFKAFALSMLRVLSDFLAQSVVKNFLTFLTAAGKSPSGVPGMPAAGADSVGEGFDVRGLLGGVDSGISGAKTLSGLSSMWDTISRAASSAWGGFNAALDAGGSVIEGFSGAIDSAGAALSGLDVGLSGMSLALGYVGAAVQGILTILDKSKTDLGKGIQTATLAAGAALAPFTSGISLIVAPIINWIEDLFGLFQKGPSHYDLTRIAAADAASALLGSIGTTFASAARTGTAADTLGALRAGQAPAGSTPDPIRTELSLDPALAEQLGLTSVAWMENGKAIIRWANVTQDQFNQLIALFKADPSMIQGSVVGRGDISYLTPDQIKPYTDALQEGATNVLTAFTAFETVRDKIKGLATDIIAAAQDVMPVAMAQQLAEHIVNPIRDQMLALLQNPDLSVTDLQAQLDALGQTLQAKVQEWAKFSDALHAITLVDALIPADISAQMHAAVQPAYDAVIAAMRTGTAEQAKLAVETFTKQAAAWAAFGQSVSAAIDVDAILPKDLGAKFHAIMQPEYDKILATLRAGNVELAATQTAAFNKRLAVFSALGQTETAGLDLKALLPADLAAQFEAVMAPQWTKILADIATNVDLAAIELDKFNTQLAAWAKTAAVAQRLGPAETASLDVRALLPTDLAAQFDNLMAPQWTKILAELAAGHAEVAARLLDTYNAQVAVWAKVAALAKQLDLIQFGGLDVRALLPPDLAQRFESLMAPQWTKILAELAVGHADVAAALIDAFNKQVAVWAKVGPTQTARLDVGRMLPDDLAPQFKALMQPQWDKILADLAAGHADLAAAEIDKFNKQLQAWAALTKTINTIDASIAANTNRDDPAAAWAALQAQLETTAARAKAAFDAALSSGDVERIAATAAEYHDAVMANLEAQLEMVKQIDAAFQAALDSSAALVAIAIQVAQLDIVGGQGFGTITALLGSLQEMATTGTTAAQRMWAVDQALKAIIAVLPTAIAAFGSFRTKAEWLAKGMQTAAQLRASGPSAITGAVVSAASPFLAAQQAAIDAASGAARLALLKQQAEAFTALANAAIAGVNQWAEAAIRGAQEAAQAVVDGLMAQKAAALDAIDQQIAAIQTAAQADQEARQAQMQALSEQIAKAQELEAAIAGMAKFIQALKVGPLGPGNPMDKLSRAQDAYSKALAAYNANPTAAGLAGLQDLAQTMLALAEPIFSKPSPQFQSLVALTIKQLEAAAALAKGQMTDSETLKAQLKALQDADKAAAQGVQEQIAALNAQKSSISDDFDRQIKAVEDARDKQIGAIQQAAKDEIDGINAGLADALKNNMAKQAPLLQAQFDAANALLAAVGPTAQFQIDAVARLTEIRDAILGATSAASGMERVTEGLYHLHDGEMVLPRTMADRVRSAAEGADLPNTGPFAPGSGSIYDPWIVDSQNAVTWRGPMAAELNALENAIRLAKKEYDIAFAHNVYKRGGKIYYQHTPEQLAAMEAAMNARVAELRATQQAIVAAIQKAPPGPPPGGPPPNPPYVPPGPPWITRAPHGGPQAGAQLTINVTVNGDSQDEKRIAKAVAKEVLPIVQGDAKNGKLGVIIDQRAKSVR